MDTGKAQPRPRNSLPDSTTRTSPDQDIDRTHHNCVGRTDLDDLVPLSRRGKTGDQDAGATHGHHARGVGHGAGQQRTHVRVDPHPPGRQAADQHGGAARARPERCAMAGLIRYPCGWFSHVCSPSLQLILTKVPLMLSVPVAFSSRLALAWMDTLLASSFSAPLHLMLMAPDCVSMVSALPLPSFSVMPASSMLSFLPSASLSSSDGLSPSIKRSSELARVLIKRCSFLPLPFASGGLLAPFQSEPSTNG